MFFVTQIFHPEKISEKKQGRTWLMWNAAKVPSTSPNNPGILREVLDPSPSCPWSFSPQVKRLPKLVTLKKQRGPGFWAIGGSTNVGQNLGLRLGNQTLLKKGFIYKCNPPKNEHVPWRGIILKGNFIFQPSIFREYVSFRGSNGLKQGIFSGKSSHFWPNLPNLPISAWPKFWVFD